MSKNIGSDKQTLRDEILNIRKQLSKTQVKNLSKTITNKLTNSINFLKHEKYFAYLSINNEVDIKEIIQILLENDKKIYLPKFSANKWVIARFKKWEGLQRGPFNTMQPINDEGIDSSQLDLAIIPGIAIDKSGYRLGYGQGVYDKLLRGFKGKKVGLLYDFQFIEIINKEKHDLKMDEVITEIRHLKFNIT